MDNIPGKLVSVYGDYPVTGLKPKPEVTRPLSEIKPEIIVAKPAPAQPDPVASQQDRVTTTPNQIALKLPEQININELIPKLMPGILRYINRLPLQRASGVQWGDATGTQLIRPDGTTASVQIPITQADIANPSAAILANKNALYVSDTGVRYHSNGSVLVGFGGIWFTTIVDITRNSLNDATDDDFGALATFVIPPNVIRVGSIIEVWGVVEYTVSASAKQFSISVNGTVIPTAQSFTTPNTSTGFRLPIHVLDSNTIGAWNNFSVAGASGSGTSSLIVTQTVTGVVAAGMTLTIQGRWTTQPISGEFIRLKFGKVLITP